MAQTVTLFKAPNTKIVIGGRSVLAMYGPLVGGLLVNPATAEGQGIAIVEPLYYSILGDAALFEDGRTFVLQPGQEYRVPENLTTNLSVNAATKGHIFSAVVFQPPVIFIPATGTFPPGGPTTLLRL